MAQTFDIIAQLQLQGPANLGSVVGQINRGLRGANTSINIDTSSATSGVGKLNNGVAATATTMARARAQAAAYNATLQATVNVTGGLGAQLENLANQAGLAARRFVAFSAVAGGIYAVSRALREGVSAAVAFDLKMNKLAQVSGETGSQLAGVRAEIGRLATSLGVSSDSLADVAVTLKQAGVAGKDLSAALKAVALSDLAPNFDNMKQTTEGLIAVWRQFRVEAKDFQSVLGSVNAVAGEFAVEASDLVTAFQKAGGAFSSLAGDAKTGQQALAEFMGLFTSIRATTRESADTIATGLRTIFTRLQRPETVDAVRDLGINLRYTAQEARSLGDIKLENQFVGAYEAVKRLSEGLDGLRETDPRFSNVVEQLGGLRNISKVLPLLKQFETAQQAVNVATAGQLSLQTAAEKRSESLSNKTAKLKEEYLQLGRSIVDTPSFQAAANGLLSIASSFAKIVDAGKPLLPLLTALAAVKLGTSLGGIYQQFSSSFLAPVGSSGLPVKRAGGGFVPGVGDQDSIPAMLTPGEFVITRRAAKAIGYDRLHALNARGYARGGIVGLAQGGRAEDGGELLASLSPSQAALFMRHLRVVERSIGRVADGVDPTGELESAATRALAQAVLTHEGEASDFKPSRFVQRAVFSRVSDLAKRADRARAVPVSEGLQVAGGADPARLAADNEERARFAAALGGPLPTDQKSLRAAAQSLGVRGTSTAALAEGVNQAIIARLRAQQAEQAGGLVAGGSGGGVIPPIAPPTASPAPVPGGGGRVRDLSFKKFADGTYDVPARHLVGFTKALGQDAEGYSDLSNQARELAQKMGRLGTYISGTTEAVIQVKGGLAKVIGLSVPQNRSVSGPSAGLNASDPAAVQYQEQVVGSVAARRQAEDIRQTRQGRAALAAGGDPLAQRAALRASGVGLAQERADDVVALRAQNARRARTALTPEELAYQDKTLAAARFEQERQAQQAGLKDAINQREQTRTERAARQPGVDPLLAAQGDRTLRAQRLRDEAAYRQTLEDRTAATNAYRTRRDAAGLFGVTDPLRIKEAALRTINDQNLNLDVRQDVLGLARPHLSAAQNKQLEAAFLRAGGQLPGVTPKSAQAGVPSSGGFFGRFAGLSGKLDQSALGRFIGSSGGLTAALVAPLIAGQLDSAAGSAQDAVAGGNTFRFGGFRAASGGLSGAATGSFAGSVLGSAVPGVGTVIGAGVGAVVGGVGGIVGALSDVAKDIRQVKIDQALTSFSEKVGIAANVGLGRASPEVLQGLRSSLSARHAETLAKNGVAASGYLTGPDAASFVGLQSRSLRQDFGGSLPSILQSLQREADQLGRANVGGKVEDIARQLKDGGNGLNAEFISIVSQLRGVPVAAVSKELRENILSGQRAAVRERQLRDGQAAEERNSNSFGRLLLAVQSASDSLLGLRQRALALGEAFDGTVGASRVSVRAENLEQLGRLDRGALAPLNTVAAVGGGIGRQLRLAGGQVDDLSRVLPGVLTEAVRHSPTDPDHDISVEISRRLREQLGGSPGAEGAISSVVSRLSDLTKGGKSDLYEQVRVDVTALSQKLVSGLADPVKDVGGKVARQLEENANALVEGLAQAAHRARQTGELYDQLAAARSSSFRLGLEFTSQQAGRGRQALDFATLGQLESAQDARQFRLAGAVGNDPAAIGRALGLTRQQLERATERQQQAFAATGGKGDAFLQVADEVLRLKGRAADLQQALKNLADVSARTAAVQEKLNRLQQERDSRLGLAERYATASPDELVKLNRSALLANEAANAGNLNGLLSDDRRGVIDFLRSAGGTTLSGFKGSPRADDLLGNLLGKSFGGAFDLTAGQKAEEGALQQVASTRSATAEDALSVLIKSQEGASRSFFDNLTAQQQQFFTKLEALLLRERQVADTNRLGSLGREQQRLNGQADSARLLASLGIKDTASLEAARRSRGDIEALSGEYRSLDTTNRLRAQVAGGGVRQAFERERPLADVPDADLSFGPLSRNVTGTSLSGRTLDKIGGFLRKNYADLSPNQISNIQGRIGRQAYLALSEQTNAADPAAVRRQLGAYVQRYVEEELSGKTYNGAATEVGESTSRRVELENRLRGQGLNVSGLQSLAADGKGFDRLRQALDAFTGDNRLETLGDRISQTTAEFNALSQAVAGYRAASGGTTGFASGGKVGAHPGGPRGSDTVPAWLTPGEFVVNAASARANASLLRSINNAKGASYHADGGLIDDAVVKAGTGAAPTLLGAYRHYKNADWSRPSGFMRWLAGMDPAKKKREEIPTEEVMSGVAYRARGGVIYRAQGGETEAEYYARKKKEADEMRPSSFFRFVGESLGLVGRDLPPAPVLPPDIAPLVPRSRTEDPATAPAPAPTPVRPGGGVGGPPSAPSPASDPRRLDNILRGVGGPRQTPAPDGPRRLDNLISGRPFENPPAPVAPPAPPAPAPGPVAPAPVPAPPPVPRSDSPNLPRFLADDLRRREAAKAGEFVGPVQEAPRGLDQAQQAREFAQFKAEEAATNKELAFQAATNPYGASSLLLTRRGAQQAANSRYAADREKGVSKALAYARGAASIANAVGSTHLLGQVLNFNQRSSLVNGPAAPGSEGQRAIGEAALRNTAAAQNEFARRDYRYHDYLRSRTQPGVIGVRRFATGGHVPGSGISDSVPALLTPGEFVLSRQAASRMGGSALQHLNRGGFAGRPAYLADGGTATGSSSGGDSSQLAQALTTFGRDSAAFGQSATQLSQAFATFNSNSGTLAEALAAFPKQMTGTFQHTVQVNHNGAAIFEKLTPEIQAMVTSEVKKTIGRVFKEHMPDAGVPAE